MTKVAGPVKSVVAGVDIFCEALGRPTHKGRGDGVLFYDLEVEMRDVMGQVMQGQHRIVQGQRRMLQSQERVKQAVNGLVLELMRTHLDQWVCIASPRGDWARADRFSHLFLVPHSQACMACGTQIIHLRHMQSPVTHPTHPQVHPGKPVCSQMASVGSPAPTAASVHL